MTTNEDIDDTDLNHIERFIVHTYSVNYNATDLNEARRNLFTKGNRSIESLPPTSAAFKQHIKRARYQTSIWADMKSLQVIPNPVNWG